MPPRELPTTVSVRREAIVLPTYEPQAPDKNPMFLERRVYQGSSGRVYPLPFIDRIAEKPEPHAWDGVWIENEFLRVLLLPEIGGRIHRAIDKTNGYDLIYYQPVIKPALVGLAGPWVSGGIEFNWPQHHRPSTFMPADVHIEKHDDGAITVWMSEHDPMCRMKGMHGVCLHPGRAVIELKARAYNRTADTQTFLWWANVATRVHENYQSFFPPDATFVADHAKRATSTYPLCSDHYYGVNYAARGRDGVPAIEVPRQFVPPHCAKRGAKAETQNYRADDLSWYANIPVPTSYMCLGSSEDFFGGYDHAARAGIVHVCDHHISPGKKQWTWGNQEFGYAWDRNLTDADEHGVFAPYIEIMAGVFTDNQPDFSFLGPGETKTWSQFWYPIREIGPAQHANVEVAASLRVERGIARVGISVTSTHAGAKVVIQSHERELAHWTRDITPAKPFLAEKKLPARTRYTDLTLRVLTADGRELLCYTPKKIEQGEVPPPATEPRAPREIASADELYLTGLHLEQYRHATRMPETYWREALRRDPGDARCNLALGRWHLHRGEFSDAERFLRASIARLTARNPNPAEGEAHYQLGLCLRHQAFASDSDRDAEFRSSKLVEAYAALSKAAWNDGWQHAAFHALAEIDCLRADWTVALDHLDRALRRNTDNLRARDLKVLVLRRLDRHAEAEALLRDTLALDPLDWWALHLRRESIACDNQVRLDLAHDYARAGFFQEALDALAAAKFEPTSGTAPLVGYTRAWLCHLSRCFPQRQASPVCNVLCDKQGSGATVVSDAMGRNLAEARAAESDYCFPARLEEVAILEFAIATDAKDARAPFYLGNLLYDRRRHREAITQWERAAQLEPANAVAWRNLGIAYFNVLRKPTRARHAYEMALRANSDDARLLFERDQLWKRLGVAPAKRLRELERRRDLVDRRDDLTVELCALYNQTGAPEKARVVLARRKFQPWEGGEGQALGQHVRTHLLLGRSALERGDATEALTFFEYALAAPKNLGEAKHLLANQSDIHFWLGEACAMLARSDMGPDLNNGGKRALLTRARTHWTFAAAAKGDFQEMSVRNFSEMTYFSALALDRLGKKTAARKLLRDLLTYARKLARTPATIDYFATSLPTMLLFEDDLRARQTITARFLEAQARRGLGEKRSAEKILRDVLRRAPGHPFARDFSTS